MDWFAIHEVEWPENMDLYVPFAELQISHAGPHFFKLHQTAHVGLSRSAISLFTAHKSRSILRRSDVWMFFREVTAA